MSIRILHTPSFRHTQVNTRDDGTKVSITDSLKENICAAIDAWGPINDNGDCVVVAVREKLPNNDHKMGVCVFDPMEPTHIGTVATIVRGDFACLNKPVILDNLKTNIGDILERVLDKLLLLL